MLLGLNGGNVTVYGFGSIMYKDDHSYVFGCKKLDTCIERINNGTHDVGFVDRRGLESAVMTVNFGTLTSVVVVGLISGVSYLVVSKLRK